MIGKRITLLLLVMAVPASSSLMFLFESQPTSGGVAVIWLGITMALLFALALVLRRATGSVRMPVLVLSLLTAGIILIDQWMGAPWSYTGFLGYSPLAAARYYGLGNEGAALLVGSVLVGVGLLFDEWPEAQMTRVARRWLLPVLGLAENLRRSTDGAVEGTGFPASTDQRFCKSGLFKMNKMESYFALTRQINSDANSAALHLHRLFAALIA